MNSQEGCVCKCTCSPPRHVKIRLGRRVKKDLVDSTVTFDFHLGTPSSLLIPPSTNIQTFSFIRVSSYLPKRHCITRAAGKLGSWRHTGRDLRIRRSSVSSLHLAELFCFEVNEHFLSPILEKFLERPGLALKSNCFN